MDKPDRFVFWKISKKATIMNRQISEKAPALIAPICALISPTPRIWAQGILIFKANGIQNWKSTDRKYTRLSLKYVGQKYVRMEIYGEGERKFSNGFAGHYEIEAIMRHRRTQLPLFSKSTSCKSKNYGND